jgi:hypothetical protein
MLFGKSVDIQAIVDYHLKEEQIESALFHCALIVFLVSDRLLGEVVRQSETYTSTRG